MLSNQAIQRIVLIGLFVCAALFAGYIVRKLFLVESQLLSSCQVTNTYK